MIQFFAVSLLKKSKRQNSLLFVENKNLKNTIKNMENELRGAKDALRAEECKFVQLNEKLKSKMVTCTLIVLYLLAL